MRATSALRSGWRSVAYARPIALTAVALIVVAALIQPQFIDSSTWPQTAAAATTFVLLAMAQAAPIIAGGGGIDLSVGPFAGFVNAYLAGVLFANGLTLGAAIAVILGLAVMVGAVNGILIAYLRVPPIIATLGTYLVFSGLTLRVLPTPGGLVPEQLTQLSGAAGVVPLMPVFVLVVLLGWGLLLCTAFRRNLYATGSDERSAYTAGVRTGTARGGAYIVSAVVAAVTGIAMTAVLGSGDPNASSSFTLTAIAGVALGGVALTGGRGGFVGAAFGGLVLYLTQNVLSLIGMDVYQIQIAYGVIVLAAIAVNRLGTTHLFHLRRPRPALN
jgi:ribose transport system permease protein